MKVHKYERLDEIQNIFIKNEAESWCDNLEVANKPHGLLDSNIDAGYIVHINTSTNERSICEGFYNLNNGEGACAWNDNPHSDYIECNSLEEVFKFELGH